MKRVALLVVCALLAPVFCYCRYTVRRFHEWLKSRRAETVGRVDPDHVLASHSDAPSIMTLPLLVQGAPDDWRMAKVVDVWGTSFYPKHAGARKTNDPPVRSAQLAASRCACASVDKPMWLGELHGGHGYVGAQRHPNTRRFPAGFASTAGLDLLARPVGEGEIWVVRISVR